MPPVSVSVRACNVINERLTASVQSVEVVNRSVESCQQLPVAAMADDASIGPGSG
jgi:hypothetical protein